MRITEMIAGFVDADVDFVVIGGIAGGIHGATRLTFDLDICYDPAPDNRRRLAEVLTGWHAYPRGVEPGLPFTLDARALEVSHVLTLTTDVGDLDVMDAVEGVGPYSEVLKHSVKAELAGKSFRVIDLPALLKAKRATKRPKDAEQIPELEGLLELRRRRKR